VLPNGIAKFAATPVSAPSDSYLVSEFVVSKTPPFATGEEKLKQDHA
jgi:hypothetical protein